MKWSKEKPTEPGIYWVYCPDSNYRWYLAHVRVNAHGHPLIIIGSVFAWDMGRVFYGDKVELPAPPEME